MEVIIIIAAIAAIRAYLGRDTFERITDKLNR